MLSFISSSAFHSFSSPQLEMKIFLDLVLPSSSTINLYLLADVRLTTLWKSQFLYFNIFGSWVDKENTFKTHFEERLKQIFSSCEVSEAPYTEKSGCLSQRKHFRES